MDVSIVVLIVWGMFSTWQWGCWRRRAISERNDVLSHKSVVAKQQGMTNSLDDERRRDNNALVEVFDYLNEHQPFGSHNDGLMQCRGVLLHAIQNNTWRES